MNNGAVIDGTIRYVDIFNATGVPLWDCIRKTKGHGTKGGNSAKGSRPAGGFFGKVILTDPRLHQKTERQLVNAPLSGYPLGTMPW